MRGDQIQKVIDIAYNIKNPKKKEIIDQLKKEPGTAHQISKVTDIDIRLTRTLLSKMKVTGIIMAKKDNKHLVYSLNTKIYNEFTNFIKKIESYEN